MSIQIADSLRESKIALLPIEKASDILNAMLGKWSNTVDAVWDLPDSPTDGSMIQLTLSDYAGEVSEVFPLKEIIANDWLKFDLRTLWAKLLEKRADYHQQALAAIGD